MAGTAQSDTGRLKRVMLRHVRDAFHSQAAVDAQWEMLNYTSRPDFAAACEEYDWFAGLLMDRGVEIDYLPADDALSLDALYPRDTAIATDQGIISCSMGKEARMDEPNSTKGACVTLGFSVFGALSFPAKLEGGDVAWLDSRTLAVGHGYRTNDTGIRQLRTHLDDKVELIEVPLPHFRGPNDVFHLMSIFSPISPDVALVYSPLMPVPFRNLLMDRGFKLVEVPESEFDTLGCNVLAVGPKTCIAVDGNPITRKRLEKNGIEVLVFPGHEICIKGQGGPTCLTRPLNWGDVQR